MTIQVVVTGSSGYLGSALAGQLAASGVAVRGIDQHPGRWTDTVGDLTTMSLGPVLDGADVVVHCAGLHAPHVGRVAASAFVDVNVAATARLLTAAELAGVTTFVFTSTTSVYGHALEDPDRAVWVDESLVPVPRDIYDTTKLEAETLVRAHHGQGLRTITLRIARCFPEPWHTTVLNRLYRGVDRRDVVAALESAIRARPPAHEVINIAGPRVFERTDLDHLRSDAASVIAERLPWLAHEFRSRHWPLPESIDRVYVSDLAAAVLDHRPACDVRAALQEQPEPTRRATPAGPVGCGSPA